MVDHLKPYIFQSLVGLHGVLIPDGEIKNICLKFIQRIDSLRDKVSSSLFLIMWHSMKAYREIII
jgi:hypothetical protein